MEALSPYLPDQPISPYKQIRRNPKRNVQTFVSERSENFAPSNLLANFHGGGLLFGPPPLLPSSLSFHVLNAQQQKKPPLLPLPIPKPYSSLPSRNRRLSSHPNIRKINRTKDQDLTPKKAKPSTTNPKKQDDSKQDSRSITATATNDRLGPEPGDLPKEVPSRVLKSVASSAVTVATDIEDKEEFPGSVFYVSPPPSCLPLPKFSLKPKLNCNAKAGGIDAGATDNLRRMLRLR